MKVKETWWYDYPVCIVKEILKTRVKIDFHTKGILTYDKAHVQFLEKCK